ncbi:MAG: hypothetical protein LUD17_11120 [Bacteroidales bacterium]|nr:hypothetical protein [Bacteroidales bacterium]
MNCFSLPKGYKKAIPVGLIGMALCFVAFFWMSNFDSKVSYESSEYTYKSPSKQSQNITNLLNLLDSPMVTIEDLTAVERRISEVTNEEDREVLQNRIYALRHLLLKGLMPEIHKSEHLDHIFKMHSGDYSSEQQQIIDWYLDLPDYRRREWFYCRSASSLSEFQQTLKKALTYK